MVSLKLPKIEQEPVPQGKRTIRETVWGNTNAYVGGKFWMTLGITYAVGTDEAVAEWLAGEEKPR